MKSFDTTKYETAYAYLTETINGVQRQTKTFASEKELRNFFRSKALCLWNKNVGTSEIRIEYSKIKEINKLCAEEAESEKNRKPSLIESLEVYYD